MDNAVAGTTKHHAAEERAAMGRAPRASRDRHARRQGVHPVRRCLLLVPRQRARPLRRSHRHRRVPRSRNELRQGDRGVRDRLRRSLMTKGTQRGIMQL